MNGKCRPNALQLWVTLWSISDYDFSVTFVVRNLITIEPIGYLTINNNMSTCLE